MTVNMRKLSDLTRTAPAVRRFLREEDGSLLILSLQIFIIMMITLGIAIDFVRFEERRALVQSTLDRAALAAASLNQKVDPETVAKDYIDKAGLSHLNAQPKATGGLNDEWRRVEITVQDTMPTIFGPIMKINSLSSEVSSAAEESVGTVEISLVLDVSGSMNESVSYTDPSTGKAVTSTRIAVTQSAANSFIGQMFDTIQTPTAPAGRLAISIVPYNQNVVLGSTLTKGYTLSTDVSNGSYAKTCIDLHEADFGTLGIDANVTQQRTMYGDSVFSYDFNVSPWATWSIENCVENSSRAILAYGNNETVLKQKITDLVASGDTAIDFGAKWGMALLDPLAAPAITKLIASKDVSGDLTGHPFAYTNVSGNSANTAMKVLVLMTDGENTRSYSTRPAFRTGPSGLKTTSSTAKLTLTTDYWGNISGYSTTGLYYYDATRNPSYYNFKSGTWQGKPTSTLYDITFDTLWKTQKLSVHWMTDKVFSRPYGTTTAIKDATYNKMALRSQFADKDANLLKLCKAAKAKGVKVFTIAIDVADTSNGAKVLKACAEEGIGSGKYYKTSSGQLSTTFASIAKKITALRLVE